MKHFSFFPIIYFLFSFNLYGMKLNLALVKVAFKIEEIKIRYTFYPTFRSLYYVEIGKSDGLAGFVFCEERARYAVFSNPIIESPPSFFSFEILNF